MRSADQTMDSLDRLVGNGSRLVHQLQVPMVDLGNAAQSIRGFADYLNRHPDALIRGRSRR